MSDSPVADRPAASVETAVTVAGPLGFAFKHDRLATEEPLEIRLRAGTAAVTVAVTMRTPGSDFELAAGFLFNEGAIADIDELSGITYCVEGGDQQYNIVNADLQVARLPELAALERRFVTSSACGVCGKTNLNVLHDHADPIDDDVAIAYDTIVALPGRLRAGQRVFDATGGLHAAAIFDRSGRLIAAREDIGRHNALDKVIGWALMHRRVPLRGCVLLVSGRSSYEIVQKAAMARIPVVCSVSAPSSLAVSLARRCGVTLAGFVRGETFNLYTHPQRIRMAADR